MNRKQQKRRLARRQAHEPVPDVPAVLLRRARYEAVPKAHIVPAVYQRSFAVGEQVKVHLRQRSDCFLMNVRDAGTRRYFYRRQRPDGSDIDDVEAALSVVESRLRPTLDAVIAGSTFTFEHKQVLSHFLALQMVRSPTFFATRAAVVAALFADLDEGEFRLDVLAREGVDLATAREKAAEHYSAPTSSLMDMLQTAIKLTSALGHMRWHFLRFDKPLIAYSDQPVVVWPRDVLRSEPFRAPQFLPIDALEIRVPLAPTLALLMTWDDGPDHARPFGADTRPEIAERVAGELNAFTAGQADRQWMHHPAQEPPIEVGELEPLSSKFLRGYVPADVPRTLRNRRARQYAQRVGKKKYPAVAIAFDPTTPFTT